MSTYGTLFRVTTYGESHCASVGAIIDGCPPVCLLFNWFSDRCFIYAGIGTVSPRYSSATQPSTTRSKPAYYSSMYRFISFEHHPWSLSIEKRKRLGSPSIRFGIRCNTGHANCSSRQKWRSKTSWLYRNGFVPSPESRRLHLSREIRYQS